MTRTSMHDVVARRPSFNRVLMLAVVAGLLAGLAAALFNAVLTEPIIDRAVAIEEAAAQEPEPAGAHDHGEVVTRDGQRFGLWLGWAGLGVAWGALLGGAYFLGWRYLPRGSAPQWRLAVAGGGWFALGLLALLKYPANPPAVGSPDPINERMRNFVGLEALAAGLVIAAIGLAVVLLRRNVRGRSAAAAGIAVVLAGAVALFAVFPAAEQQAVGPELATVIEEFRRHAFVGQLVFWAVFAAAFTWLPAWRVFALRDEPARDVRTPLPGREPAR